MERLAGFMKLLKPGGILLVEKAQSVKSIVEKDLLLSGFINMQELPGYIDGISMVRAEKPDWETGVSFNLKKAKLGSGSTNSIKLGAVNDDDDDTDLIDEDSLLTEEDLKKPELPKLDDCEVGKSGRKACKNCTCGRAEMESSSGKISLTVTEEFEAPQSACGNCGLGDAFRCSTCPYKGMPPFKPGEKIQLSGSLLTADV
ncbi:hypothetical protein KP509_30G069000 [Ceratopteris richardii]|nr:hypothetical protein KP509_30G069000 [Ceratopteris richardii]